MSRPNLHVIVSLIVIGVLTLIVRPLPPVVQAQTAPPTPLPIYALPDARSNSATSSGSLALASDGRTLATANMINDSVTLLIPSFNRVIGEITVGRDPRSVAFTPDATRLLSANRVDATLSVIAVAQGQVVATVPLDGVWAYGVVATDRFAYVSLLGSDQIAVVDLINRAVVERIAVPDAPAGLALWGDFLYVSHFWSGEISLIYLPTARVVQTISTGRDMALSQSIEIDITRGIAYLPQTRLNADERAFLYDRAALPLVNWVDLRDLSPRRSGRIALDTADRPLNVPFALALDRFAGRLYVANAGSDSVSVIDTASGRARAHITVGANPRGIKLNRDNTLLYVHNALDGTITTIDTRTLRPIEVIPLIDLRLPLDQLLGAQLFHNASDPRLSADGWLSCATCHFDGMSDGRVWAGFPDGPRNTPLLYRLPETFPYNWSGTWDELGDIEVKIRQMHAGTGLTGIAEAGDPLTTTYGSAGDDLDLLATYLTTILPPPTNPNRFDAAQIDRGRAVFEAQNCTDCHIGPAGTNLQRYDVGTGGSPFERGDGSFDTPSLRWLWASAPYYHDGRAATLYEVFAIPGAHNLRAVTSPEEVDDLVAYLLSLPLE